MYSSLKLSRDWTIGFYKNVPKLIVIGIMIALIGFVFGLIIMNTYPLDEIFPTGRKQTFALTIFGLSRFILYGGLALVLFGIFMYVITRTAKPSD